MGDKLFRSFDLIKPQVYILYDWHKRKNTVLRCKCLKITGTVWVSSSFHLLILQLWVADVTLNFVLFFFWFCSGTELLSPPFSFYHKCTHIKTHTHKANIWSNVQVQWPVFVSLSEQVWIVGPSRWLDGILIQRAADHGTVYRTLATLTTRVSSQTYKTRVWI